jgi:hypothetical protein
LPRDACLIFNDEKAAFVRAADVTFEFGLVAQFDFDARVRARSQFGDGGFDPSGELPLTRGAFSGRAQEFAPARRYLIQHRNGG